MCAVLCCNVQCSRYTLSLIHAVYGGINIDRRSQYWREVLSTAFPSRKHPEKFGGENQAPDARVGISWQASEAQ